MWRKPLLGNFIAQGEGREGPPTHRTPYPIQAASSLRLKGILLEPLSTSAPEKEWSFLKAS